uniref:Uncharacterized protein n=1 Tax=Molossus molossus TaxID=27622 RepID=A0A7J8J883_MOLMO|nr:hypothetical protein HJG59_009565 [Molossus molossus]
MQSLFQNILYLMLISVILSLAILWSCRQWPFRAASVIGSGVSSHFHCPTFSPTPPLVALFRNAQRLVVFSPSSRQGVDTFFFCRGPHSNYSKHCGPHMASAANSSFSCLLDLSFFILTQGHFFFFFCIYLQIEWNGERGKREREKHRCERDTLTGCHPHNPNRGRGQNYNQGTCP